MADACSIAVIIPVYNEERHIGRAIASVSGIARQIIVVDSGSTDRTVEIAAEMGAEVIQIPFESFAQKINDALNLAPIACDWVMRLDADEYAEEDLRNLIKNKLPRLEPQISGVIIKRKCVFFDRWIRHGGRYPLYELRIWRRGCVHMEHRLLDEQLVVDEGRTVQLDGNVTDHNLSDMTSFINKHNFYATAEAIEIMNARYGLVARDKTKFVQNASRQVVFKRFIKEKIYNRLPAWVGPLLYFLYRYFIRLGFLDGFPGLVYHSMQGGWYRFLVNIKVYELERSIKGIGDTEKIKERIEQITKRRLE